MKILNNTADSYDFNACFFPSIKNLIETEGVGCHMTCDNQVCFTVFLFLILKKRFGKLKAVFYTLYSDCILGFLVGVLITLLAGAQDPTVFGITPIASIYYYFIGLLVMTISVALVLVGMLTYAILSGIHERKLKKHQRCG